MKAADIVPGDYEVTCYGNPEQRTIVGVEELEHRVYVDGRDISGHLATTKFAVDTGGHSHALQSVRRPWSAARGEAEARADGAERQEAVIAALQTVLGKEGGSVRESYSYTGKLTGGVSLGMTVVQAEGLLAQLTAPAGTGVGAETPGKAES